ncbi:hypothetical protein AGATL06_10670 [Agathobaculum sp. TL06]
MKKRLLSLILAVALCMGLTVPAFAAQAGDTTLTDIHGWQYTLSQPIIGTETVQDVIMGDEFTVFLVPAGTVLTVDTPRGFCVSTYDETKGWRTTYELYADTLALETGKTVMCVQSDGSVYTGEQRTAFRAVEQGGSTTQPAQDTETETGFSDVKSGAYYADAVAWAVEQGITTGTSDTTFSPEELCTRGQIITFLWRAAGSPEPQSMAGYFADVSRDSYYFKATQWANEQGMTTGIGFDPDYSCTRADAVDFMWKMDGKPEAAAPAAFTDVPDYYADAVAWAVEQGVTTGTSDTTFSPSDTCTRGQIVTFLYRAFA